MSDGICHQSHFQQSLGRIKQAEQHVWQAVVMVAVMWKLPAGQQEITYINNNMKSAVKIKQKYLEIVKA